MDTRRDSALGPEMESLEGRSLMSSAFASVGLTFEAHALGAIVPTAFSTEGVLEDDGLASGDTFIAGPSGRVRAGGLAYDSIERLADGRFRRHPGAGTLGGTVESNGGQFLTTDGFPAGWWMGNFGGGAEEGELIVERAQRTTLSDFVGTWRFSLIGAYLPTEDFYNGNGRLVVGGAGEIQWAAEGGFVPGDGDVSGVISVSADGRLLTDFDEYFYLSRDGSVMIFADLSESENQVYIGMAVRDNADVAEQELVGDYLLEWAFTDGPAADGPNGEVDYRQRYLRLEPDGEYRIWNLDGFDSGHDRDADALSRGFWHVGTDGTLYLEQTGSLDIVSMAVSENLSTLVGLDLDNGTTIDAILGVATRAFPFGRPGEAVEPILNIPASVPQGRPVVYQLGVDYVWEAVDLMAEAGGPIISGEMVSWVDPKDGLGYAAGMSSTGLILFSQPRSGWWSYRNLSLESGGESVERGLGVMVAPDGIVTLTGLTGQGEVVRYTQTGRSTSAGFSWACVNINDHDLAPVGERTPAFVGELVSYATAWGGLNVAGLDAAGRIWSVWWAPGLARWSVADLTAASGARPLSSSLTVYLTPWNGINIAGLDSSGHIQVTWWVPSFGGNWAQNDLTAETGGAIFVPGSLSSYVSAWGGLNVAGIERGTGEVKVYWWAPARVNDGWAVTSLDAVLQPDAPLIYGNDLRGMAGTDGSLNVFGYGSDGSLIRYFWEPTFGAAWVSENVTATAVDR